MIPAPGLRRHCLEGFEHQSLFPKMHLVPPESSGPSSTSNEEKQSCPSNFSQTISSSLPFGQHQSLEAIAGSPYSTAQTVVQQCSYVLSDKIFSYSPETFDLDIAVKRWHEEKQRNGFGFQTGVQSMQTRAGAGSIALGYMFSPDFDLSKRHMPQSIIASTATLPQLRPVLDQLSLLYNLSNPFLIQVAALDYSASASPSLVTDYVTAQTIAEDLGLALVSSTSIHESQHMSIFTTLLAQDMPSLHIYDGVEVARETTKVTEVLGPAELFKTYQRVSKVLSSDVQKHMDQTGKAANVWKAFNDELGTDYKPFEYYGHSEAESVLVVFGSVEGSLAAQLAYALGNNGKRVGAVNVRMYRPFIDEAFLDALPRTVKNIAVLGQVFDQTCSVDTAQHSLLYTDVLAALTFSPRDPWISVIEKKYSREEVWTPAKMLSQLHHVNGSAVSEAANQATNLDILGSTVQQYSFWDTDNSINALVATQLASYLSETSAGNVALRSRHDNLARGGVVRADVRCSPRAIEAPYSVTSVRIAFVGEERLLNDFAITDSIQEAGVLVVRLPNSNDQDPEKFEKRIPTAVREAIVRKSLHLLAFDPGASSKVVEDEGLETLLLRMGFLRLVQNNFADSLAKLQMNQSEEDASSQLLADLQIAFRHIDIPESWKEARNVSESQTSLGDICANSFVKFDKDETEPPSYLKTWITAAKGLSFKEATGMRTALRPDLGVKTSTVRVKEHRRLTPKTYDRNIFHIEFDLGESGLTYNIGEALGIHAENDKTEVEQFIKWYGLDPDDVVEVPSREDIGVLENRTVYQSLMQNIDIFGRPPKRFYEALADFASDEKEKKELLALGGPEGAVEFKRRGEVDTVTFADILLEFPSAHPAFHDIVRIVNPMKRREYSIASSQKIQPNSVSLLIVTVEWVDPKGRDRFGQATRYLDRLKIGAPVTVSVKPSVMKLPPKTTAPLVMAGLGTGLAPFRAFVQERAWQTQQGHEIGSVLLYMGSRHQREEYLYGEEWEAYQDAGVITLLGRAFSRDQPQKVYIQDRMRETMNDIRKSYLHENGSFYLCGPTWPVPDVTAVLQDTVEVDAEATKLTKKVDSRREIEKLKDENRFVLEVY